MRSHEVDGLEFEATCYKVTITWGGNGFLKGHGLGSIVPLCFRDISVFHFVPT